MGIENEVDIKEIEEMQRKLEEHEPIPIAMHITQKGFDFLISQLRILDSAKYKNDHNISIVNKHSNLTRYQCRLVMNDNSSKLINIREEK
ncbi:hypothetical protein [Clostridium sp.]|uniref:hypothetical protein n=1 Tax=Clostridium sp. TaxID=1506 RepID=UPI001A3F40AD|nr:hypothetical protein [Clostridium sp.]MBK5239865.1 hypothetical protein [Clostridium sp.]